MWIALNWTLTTLAIACWSALCLALQAVARLLGSASGRPSDWLQALERWQFPAWLADWLPMAAITALKSWLTDWLSGIGPWLDIAAAAWPALLSDWLAPLLWLLWGVGTVSLLGLGLVGHVLVRALGAPRGPAATVQARSQGA
ncbi:hypothetical protein [Aquabacterium sp. OR-4]|uniref:hypothetical protein n=1 Tax=Aquabacterium sp. OR-4 TaxID=2978127 RepID=UPI0028C9D710|nr:hypothetical protein [Aquabacterium sp. OR-4]MDT7835107.1 hypothetical protein [Aquabacterium sp. OR-4]